MSNPWEENAAGDGTSPRQSLRIRMDEEGGVGARIKVIGIGGAGCNAVNRMVRSGLDGVEFVQLAQGIRARCGLSHRSGP
jgi:hypothetical protein